MNCLLEQWSLQDLQTNFSTSSSMLDFDISAQVSFDAIMLEVFESTIFDRTLLNANLHSDLRTSYLDDFSLNVFSRHSLVEILQTTYLRISYVVDHFVNTFFEKTNLFMTSNRLDFDLRTSFFDNFFANIFNASNHDVDVFDLMSNHNSNRSSQRQHCHSSIYRHFNITTKIVQESSVATIESHWKSSS